MKNWMMLLGAVALLSSCGRYDFQPAVSFGVQVTDAVKSGKVTRVVDEETGTSKYTFVAGEPVQFSFTARPGSQSGYVTGYKVVRSNINGDELVNQDAPVNLKTNIFIPAGYICPDPGALAGFPGGDPAEVEAQPCSITDPNSRPGNTHSDTIYGLELGNTSLLNKAASENRSQIRSTDIVFMGYSATYQPFEIRVTNVVTGVDFESQ